MFWKLLGLLGVLLALTPLKVMAFNSFTITLLAYDEQCFIERLKPNERLDISYEVVDGASLEIDFAIFNRQYVPIHSYHREKSGVFGFNAQSEDDFTYCFSNRFSQDAKIASFTIHGPDEKFKIEEKAIRVVIDDSKDEVLTEISALDEGIKSIRDSHSYRKRRDEVHRRTADSTNSRVVWWTLFQIILICATCVFQVLYIKHFFEAKHSM